MKFLSDGEETTLSFAEKFASSLKGGEIILLDGRLGAGKTVFVKGIAKGLDIDEEVTSPTFTLMNEYQGRLNLVHMDVYRLKSALEAYEAGLTEYFGESNTVCCIEWAENIRGAFDPCSAITVRINYLGDGKREIEIFDK